MKKLLIFSAILLCSAASTPMFGMLTTVLKRAQKPAKQTTAKRYTSRIELKSSEKLQQEMQALSNDLDCSEEAVKALSNDIDRLKSNLEEVLRELNSVNVSKLALDIKNTRSLMQAGKIVQYERKLDFADFSKGCSIVRNKIQDNSVACDKELQNILWNLQSFEDKSYCCRCDLQKLSKTHLEWEKMTANNRHNE